MSIVHFVNSELIFRLVVSNWNVICSQTYAEIVRIWHINVTGWDKILWNNKQDVETEEELKIINQLIHQMESDPDWPGWRYSVSAVAQKKTGEWQRMQLAFILNNKFSWTALINLLCLYSRPE
jgi:hypothetical protein